jgi:flagellar biosynthetic protein FliO
MAKISGAGASLLPALAMAAEAEPARRFAAPDAAASLPQSGAGGIGQVTLALLLVLAVVFVLAFVLRKMRAVTGAGVNGIEVLAQTSLGARERAVVVRVEGTRLLLGVAQGHVSLLQVLPQGAPPPAAGSAPPPATPAERPTFSQLLRRSLGR